jgi:hypothetical protein
VAKAAARTAGKVAEKATLKAEKATRKPAAPKEQGGYGTPNAEPYGNWGGTCDLLLQWKPPPPRVLRGPQKEAAAVYIKHACMATADALEALCH